MNLFKEVKVTRVLDAAAAGTTDQESAVLDMQGFESVAFLVAFGEITASAVTSVKVQQGAASDGSDMADLAGTGVTVADDDDDQCVLVEVHRPQERYVRVVVDRGTQNAVIDGAFGFHARYPLQHHRGSARGSRVARRGHGLGVCSLHPRRGGVSRPTF
jgi:predicted ribosome-associated RNA-binding protein Tma20